MLDVSMRLSSSSALNSVAQHIVDGSPRLYLFFGGIAGAIGMPPFEFYRAAGILEYSKVFLRDPRQAWYQRGLPEVGESAADIGRFLESLILDSGCREVIFVGNSMGGYAALMFSAMLKTGRVIAFAPQTFIDAEQRMAHRDSRWAEQITALHQAPRPDDILSLRPWIETKYPSLRASIHVPAKDRLDRQHAEKLRGLEAVEIRSYDFGGHGLVKELRESGALADILGGRV